MFGFDVELFAEILKNPSAWLDGPGTPVPLPPPLDVFNNVGLFAAGEHARLDTIIGFDEPGLTDQHHDLAGNRRLDDDAAFVISEFAPLENTITTAKLLLLDGDQLDAVLSAILGRSMNTYPSGDTTNVMINALGGGDPWLSQHRLRPRMAPRRAAAVLQRHPAAALPARRPTTRSPRPNGGAGQMPIWESCVARPAFAELYTDWENGSGQFPDLGDGLSADPGSDPNPPTSSVTLDPTSAFFNDTVNNRLFVGGDNVFMLGAVDTPAGKGSPSTSSSCSTASPTPTVCNRPGSSATQATRSA